MAINYFQNLYAYERTNPPMNERVFQNFPRRITPEINQDLTRRVIEEEVRMAVMDIGAHKAPRPNGFTVVFYRTYWEDVKEDLMKEITVFFF